MIRTAHYRVSLAGGGTDLPAYEAEYGPTGLCVVLTLPWSCSLTAEGGWSVGSWSHDLPTQAGLASSAAMAMCLTGDPAAAWALDRHWTGAGWQDAYACAQKPGVWVLMRDEYAVTVRPLDLAFGYVLFDTGKRHECAYQPQPDMGRLEMAKADAVLLVKRRSLGILCEIMKGAQARKPPIDVTFGPEVTAAKLLGSRGAGFGIAITSDPEKTATDLERQKVKTWRP